MMIIYLLKNKIKLNIKELLINIYIHKCYQKKKIQNQKMMKKYLMK